MSTTATEKKEQMKSAIIEAFGLADAFSPALPDADWLAGLERYKGGANKGKIIPSLSNLTTILGMDVDLPRPELNRFTCETVTRSRDRVNGEVWTDRHDAALRLVVERRYGLSISARDLADAVSVHTETHDFHPVRDWLASLRWDGQPRCAGLFTKWLGAPADDYHVECAELFLMGAVVRVMEPGHKFDFVPIIEGAQGRGKSTFIEILASGWFAGLEGSFDDRNRLVEKMQGAWILEVPELSGFTRSEVQVIKDFVSSRQDKVRLAYGRRAVVYPRQSVMMGSTNETNYLRDPTGNRRFWPISCRVDAIDVDGLRGEVEQVWAEAFWAYQEARKAVPGGVLDLSLHSAGSRRVAAALQGARRAETAAEAWAGIIASWLDGHDETCLIQLWVDALGRNKDDYRQIEARQIGDALRELGEWEFTGEQIRFDRFGKQRVIRRVRS